MIQCDSLHIRHHTMFCTAYYLETKLTHVQVHRVDLNETNYEGPTKLFNSVISNIHSVLSVLLRLVLSTNTVCACNATCVYSSSYSTSISLYGNIEILTEFNLVLFLLFPVSNLVSQSAAVIQCDSLHITQCSALHIIFKQNSCTST